MTDPTLHAPRQSDIRLPTCRREFSDVQSFISFNHRVATPLFGAADGDPNPGKLRLHGGGNTNLLDP